LQDRTGRTPAIKTRRENPMKKYLEIAVVAIVAVAVAKKLPVIGGYI
jgi:hypothetical protein